MARKRKSIDSRASKSGTGGFSKTKSTSSEELLYGLSKVNRMRLYEEDKLYEEVK